MIMMQDLSDDDLMRQYQKGEALAMDELVRRYKNPIYRFACRLCVNAHEAQDVAQEVFLRLHQYKDNFSPQGKFSSWLFSIAHNLCVSRLRRRKWWAIWPRMPDCPDEPVETESPHPSPDAVVEVNETQSKVKECIGALPFLQREALILREYENLDYRDIARILKKPQGTVKTLIYRARQNLKTKLLPYVEELGGLR